MSKTEQPPAGEYPDSEFTKIQRLAIESCEASYEGNEWLPIGLQRLAEACDRLDRSEAENKKKDELLFAYESVRAPKQPLAGEPKKDCDNCVYLEADGEIINGHIEKEKALESIIDRSEASRKELLVACENLKKIYIEGSGNTSWMANYSDMDAAIKAEKEVKK